MELVLFTYGINKHKCMLLSCWHYSVYKTTQLELYESHYLAGLSLWLAVLPIPVQYMNMIYSINKPHIYKVLGHNIISDISEQSL